MKFEMSVGVVIRDKNGKVLNRIRKRRCNSYVRAMIDFLATAMGRVSVSCPDVGNVARNISQQAVASFFCVDAAAGVTDWGIRAGTGVAAVTIADYKLTTPIAHGAGAGQLNHGAVSVGVPVTVGSTRQFTVARTFTNNSGGDITVEEVGLQSRAFDWGTGASYYFLIEHSLLSFLISNTLSATVTYTISVTV